MFDDRRDPAVKKALLLDRDGVINHENGYVYQIDEFKFIDGIFQLCRYFQDLEYLIIILTNQSGIARGLFSSTQYQYLENWMLQQFRENNIMISAVYHCPHHPEYDIDCGCRKPKPGMLLKAKSDFHLDLRKSILIGDNFRDLDAGNTAGVCNLILFGNNCIQLSRPYTYLSVSEITQVQDYHHNTGCLS